MLLIPEYTISELIYTGTKSIVYRGNRNYDKKAVVIKVTKDKYPTPTYLAKFKHQYEIIKNLEITGVVKYLGIENYENRLALIMEDDKFECLKNVIPKIYGNLDFFLKIAVQLSEILNDLHHNNIIHKDIKPANIIINSIKEQVKIIDFSSASLLSKEKPTISDPSLLEGTLAYMAPEQTGRMNRLIDYRTDFYSLGVTFYEILTGQLPYQTTEAMELVHCHIAKQAVPPVILVPDIPPMISSIVMKLLAKTAEDRYQSAFGLKADLEQCLAYWKTGNIPNFPLGVHDLSSHLLIPQKLYGREAEVAQLLAAFERVSSGAHELILVTGCSGCGKSALVNEIHKSITQRRGYFISGKFDQLQRNVPYAAFINAFQELIRQLLTETPQQLHVWKQKILNAVGFNGRILIDVIPELEYIIGSQPIVSSVGLTEIQNRFYFIFNNFIQVFTQKEHPLVLFLDDLQWADLESLKLIQILIDNSNIQSLLLIGAYRNNEMDAMHPLNQIIEDIQGNAIVSYIDVRELNITFLNQLLADTLKCQKEYSLPLAKLVFEKTHGNPFFLIQLLQEMNQENLIFLNDQLQCWEWNIKQIHNLKITDNVVELMVGKLKKLNQSTQHILKLAACIGSRFDLETLSFVNQKSQQATAFELWEALQVGLVTPLSDSYKIPLTLDQKSTDNSIVSSDAIAYEFLHDRVQQAAYSLISDDQKQEVHLKIGQLLLENTSLEEQENKIFDIVNHLNIGANLICQQSNRNKLAELNLIAGRKAKAATAYKSAIAYLNFGLKILESNTWKTQYNLTLALYQEAAEIEYITTNFQQAVQLCDIALNQGKTILDKIPLYNLKIKINIAKNEVQKALDTGLKVLSLLSISLHQAPQQTLVIEDLIKLPEMKDVYKIAAMQILITIQPPSSFGDTLLSLPIIYTMLELCIRYGNSPCSAYVYAMYSVILCARSLNIDTAYQFGQLALQVLDKFQAKAFKCKAIVALCLNVIHRKEHTKNTLEVLRQAVQNGLEVGDVEFACHAAMYYCQHLFFAGETLQSVVRKHSEYIDLIIKYDQKHQLYLAQIDKQLVINLIEESSHKDSLIGKSFNELKMLPFFKKTSNIIAIFFIYFAKILLAYLFKKYQKSIENAREAEKYIGHTLTMIVFIEYKFYYSLALLAHYSFVNVREQKKYLGIVVDNQEKIEHWAHYAPMNYQHKYDLIVAEKARVIEETLTAMEYYDRAIASAKEQGYIQVEAIACERAAEFYLSLGRKKIARMYMIDAYYNYFRWGAIAKVRDLETNYPEFFSHRTMNQTGDESSSIISLTTDKIQALDLATVTKASQALATETNLTNLLEQLIRILIENAGAKTGFLILAKNEQLFIEASSSVEQNNVSVMQSTSIETNPDISVAIINYVNRTRETVVLNNALFEGRFTNDPYIIKNQSKSILCTPIINQGRLVGIVFLENNLAIGAFTPKRLEILKLLSAQAAISIENTLLRNAEQNSAYEYHVGGSLPLGTPTYIVRQADRELYKALKSGRFCHILNSRQMGKSSLRVQIMQQLQTEGFACATVDISEIGHRQITLEQWYAGFIYVLVNSFNLTDKFNIRTWWHEHEFLSPVQRLGEFITKVLLEQISQNIVVFVDEIDSILSLKIELDDFFLLIRNCYNKRADHVKFRRLSFVLLGVATPGQFIQDKSRTPFNIGQAIQLKGFQLHEAQPLLQGLIGKVSNPQAVLKEVLFWTNGQPFLTQKLCKLICASSSPVPTNHEAEWVENLVRQQVIENWELQDEPEHLKTIRDRLCRHTEHNRIWHSKQHALLLMYQQILEQGKSVAVDTPEQTELLLSGLVVKQHGYLEVSNQIYKLIFDCSWVERMLVQYC
ncbi:AAA family ATPase [Gloeocapsopsis crepidinum LEGE 06123]|uniref:AAA family ATPase n=1 Tax=Gloeocapsopsis crepidinum LEGE 06123 TaxID=588587 RepID=A0ABR9UYN5_9CHRO|nr:AAA family ATPase [Gloeocapsopsis crepidinum]MBE9193404.1 AAA family ATPase [Gloeocapsopsis crepidinum LEGE 06123]